MFMNRGYELMKNFILCSIQKRLLFRFVIAERLQYFWQAIIVYFITRLPRRLPQQQFHHRQFLHLKCHWNWFVPTFYRPHLHPLFGPPGPISPLSPFSPFSPSWPSLSERPGTPSQLSQTSKISTYGGSSLISIIVTIRWHLPTIKYIGYLTVKLYYK